ncbi:crotonase/enoyl-CoA hydratase family protein [Rugosimonospora africana]|uniref:Enoyl-CoA hydratase n=1 Tax=Rugosimonospora africana TaxID=556532 RepID=A0A8J3R0F7_9ACTN|nr:crotonase/enoyl-CoA hydratase family protein [Rugosimonospora africana]GIH19522.1 enoyl-CoA hydratase [Rugosimonospora africana]
MNDPILVSHEHHILTLTLNRPETRNAISEPEMVDGLERAVAEANGDPSVRAVIITGAGPAFSSGGNLKHMRDRSGMFAGGPARLREGYRHGIQRIPLALYHCEVPTIAAVNGPAIGAGCDLALMCDIRIAANTAVFAESFVKVGLVPGDGGAWLLPRAVGLSRACEMAFTGEGVDAATALGWGLVSRVVEPERLIPAATELAGRIVANPPDVLRMTKKLIREGQHHTLGGHLELAAAYQAIAHHTEDHHEAVTALLDRRPAAFG